MRPKSTFPRAIPALAACLSVPASGAALAETRELSGAITNYERIALPDDSLVLIEALDADEQVVAETRLPTDGGQVPLAFALEVPADTLLTVRAGLRWPDGRLWLTLPQGLAPGRDDLDLGEIRARRTEPMGFASLLRCGDVLLEFGVVADGARLRSDEGFWRLGPVPAASGTRFEAGEDATTWVWTRGDTALVSVAGQELPECTIISPAADLAQLRAIRTLEGEAVNMPERAEIAFSADGRISAGLGCNRFVGGYSHHGGMLSLGQIAATLMACPDALAAEEQRLLAVLVRIDGYRLDAEGGLSLMAEGEVVLEAGLRAPD